MNEEKNLSIILDEIFNDYILNNDDPVPPILVIQEQQADTIKELVFNSMPKSEEPTKTTDIAEELPMPQLIEPEPPIIPPLVSMPPFTIEKTEDNTVVFNETEILNAEAALADYTFLDVEAVPPISPPETLTQTNEPLEQSTATAISEETHINTNVSPGTKETAIEVFNNFETTKIIEQTNHEFIYIALKVYHELEELQASYLKIIKTTRYTYNKNTVTILKNDIEEIMPVIQCACEEFASYNFKLNKRPLSNNKVSINDIKQKIIDLCEDICKLKFLTNDKKLKSQLCKIRIMLYTQAESLNNLLYL